MSVGDVMHVREIFDIEPTFTKYDTPTQNQK